MLQSAESKSSKRNALEVELKNESFLMTAKSERDKDEWISRISKAIMHYSNLYMNDFGDVDVDDENDDTEEVALAGTS